MVLVFDMDGVLVDNHLYHQKAWIEFGRRHGITITETDFLTHFGSTNHTVLKSLFGNALTDTQITLLGEEKELIYKDMYASDIKPLKGLTEFLALSIERNIPLALATSAPKVNVDFTLKATGLTGYFNLITDSSMVSKGKPDPEVYLVTAAKLGVNPSDCIVFEDSVPGIISAKNAGMRVIGVATTHNPQELMIHVKEIIMNFAEPENLLNSLLKI